jgi:hypothetical protein
VLTLTRAMGPTVATSIPNRPAISNVLIKASANPAFRIRLLADAEDAVAEMNVPPEDVKILTDVRTATLQEYASQVRTRLMVGYPGAGEPAN